MTSMKAFKASYKLLQEKLPAYVDRMPGAVMAFAIFKQTFADNKEFAVKCAHFTVTKDDIRAVANGTNDVLTIIDECSADEFEELVKNLAFLAQDLGYK